MSSDEEWANDGPGCPFALVAVFAVVALLCRTTKRAVTRRRQR